MLMLDDMMAYTSDERLLQQAKPPAPYEDDIIVPFASHADIVMGGIVDIGADEHT